MKEKIVRNCVSCDKKFKSAYKNKFFCSWPCRDSYIRNNRRMKKNYPNCFYCGKDISTLKGKRKFCSNSCYHKNLIKYRINKVEELREFRIPDEPIFSTVGRFVGLNVGDGTGVSYLSSY